MRRACLVLLLIVYCSLILPFAGFMKNRPVEVKLGYLPHPQLLKTLTADHALLVSEMAVVKVLFYYGSIVEHYSEKVIIRPEQANMYRMMQIATYLDPYNNDAYYFAQAAFTWELGRVKEVNALLEKGAEFRSWDPWINFYLGFNYSYFLKDYQKAAKYYQRAGELAPKNTLFSNLAARYLYESDQNQNALAFLDAMISQAKDKAVRKTYVMRRDALRVVQSLEDAQQRFLLQKGRHPDDIAELLKTGFISQMPQDPYGGEFYLDEQEKMRSTSNFASAKKKK